MAFFGNISDLKYYANFDYLSSYIQICRSYRDFGICRSTFAGNYDELNYTIIFGLFNCLVWCWSTWLVFKKTKFYKQNKHIFKKPSNEEKIYYINEKNEKLLDRLLDQATQGIEK